MKVCLFAPLFMVAILLPAVQSGPMPKRKESKPGKGPTPIGKEEKVAIPVGIEQEGSISVGQEKQTMHENGMSIHQRYRVGNWIL